MIRAFAGLPIWALLLTACGGEGAEPIGDHPPRNLSDWGLFEGAPALQMPADGVIGYAVNTELFSDHAQKLRFVRVPPGEAASYHSSGAMEFPVGTVLVKTFAYPADPGISDGPLELIETRLLVRTHAGWQALPYVWNAEQTDARLSVGGFSREVSMVDPDGTQHSFEYLVPNVNMCAQCHTETGTMAPLGPKARNLNRDFEYPSGAENQLDHWRRIGILDGGPSSAEAPMTPPYDDPAAGSVEERARGWLDINCASCHSPRGKAGTSGMYLGVEIKDPLRLGVGKPPVAAGRGTGGHSYGILPGHPERSILIHRIQSTEAGVAMPEIGRQLVPQAAVDLLSEWIEAM